MAAATANLDAEANLDAAGRVWDAKAWGAKAFATNRKGLRRGRDCVLAAGSILAKCKTSPTLLLVLTMLKA
jgi:hypothetical protein